MRAVSLCVKFCESIRSFPTVLSKHFRYCTDSDIDFNAQLTVIRVLTNASYSNSTAAMLSTEMCIRDRVRSGSMLTFPSADTM